MLFCHLFIFFDEVSVRAFGIIVVFKIRYSNCCCIKNAIVSHIFNLHPETLPNSLDSSNMFSIDSFELFMQTIICK